MADSVATTRLALAIGVVAALLVASGAWIWSLDQRLSTAEQTREELRAGLAGAVGDFVDLAGKQETLETTIAAFPRDEDVQAEVAAIRSQVAAIEDRLQASPGADPDEVSSRLDSVEAQLAGLDVPDLGPLRDAVAGVQRDMQEVRSQIDGITPERVEQLSGRVDALTEELASLEPPDISSVVDELELLGGRLGTVETGLAGSQFSSRLDSVEAQLAELDVPDLGPLRDALASVQQNLQQVQNQVDDIAPERVDQLSGRVDALNQQLASLEIPDISSVVDELAQLDGRLDTVESDVARVASTGPESLQGRVDALAGQVAAISVPDLAPIEERLTSVATDVDALEPAVAAAASKDQVDAVREEAAGLNVQVDELGQSVASVRTQTEALSTQVGELSAALASKAESADAASLTEQLDALRQQVAALPAVDAARLEDEVAALGEALAALEPRLASLPSAGEVASLRSDLDTLAQGPRQSPAAELVERIHFGVNEASVAPEEQARIDAVARTLRESPATLQLVGFSDSKGPAELNRTLSLRRAAAVRAALIAAGVDPATVTSVVGLGEDGPPVDLGDDVEEARNRVVMVYRRP